MGLPESGVQLSFAPLRALRALFSGVGQLLLAAEKLKAEDAERDAEARDDQQHPLRPWDPYQPRSVRIIPKAADLAPLAGEFSDEASIVAAGAKPGHGAKAGSKEQSGGAKGPGRTKGSGGAKAAGGGANAGSGGSGRNGRKPGASQAQQSHFRSLDLTGNVRVLSASDLADLEEDAIARNGSVAAPDTATRSSGPVASPAASAVSPVGHAAWATETTGTTEATGTPADTPAPPAVAGTEWPYGLPASEPLTTTTPGADDYTSRASRELPIDGYDGLSLPSLRARLRNLDVPQLRQLILYEISHAYRPDVVSMFERRIARLESSDS
ncbi:MAG TPA: hypothetical protein VFQ44_18710 [Streptosporangiaceae bacterium]|nr:hypothetical protein [Streptosporangiaceae bacterium]